MPLPHVDLRRSDRPLDCLLAEWFFGWRWVVRDHTHPVRMLVTGGMYAQVVSNGTGRLALGSERVEEPAWWRQHTSYRQELPVVPHVAACPSGAFALLAKLATHRVSWTSTFDDATRQYTVDLYRHLAGTRLPLGRGESLHLDEAVIAAARQFMDGGAGSMPEEQGGQR
jgi:hypothetical protein